VLFQQKCYEINQASNQAIRLEPSSTSVLLKMPQDRLRSPVLDRLQEDAKIIMHHKHIKIKMLRFLSSVFAHTLLLEGRFYTETLLECGNSVVAERRTESRTENFRKCASSRFMNELAHFSIRLLSTYLLDE